MLSTAMRRIKLLTLAVSIIVTIWTLYARAQQPAAPATGAGPGICAGQPLCVETSDFVATVTSFRTSQQGVYKVVGVAVRFQNKTAQPLILGYAANSGIATDDRGNRYKVYGTNGYRGIGLVYGNRFDPRLTLQPAAFGDAQFELMWRPTGREVYGSTFALDLTIDKIAVDNNLYSLGGEFPLHFQDLRNRSSATSPMISGVMGAASTAANPSSVLSGMAGVAGAAQPKIASQANAAATSVQAAAQQAQAGASNDAAAAANGVGSGATAISGLAGSAGNGQAAATASRVANTASALSGLAGMFKRKPKQPPQGQQQAQPQPQAQPQMQQPQAQTTPPSQPPNQQMATAQSAIAGAQPASGGSAPPVSTASVDWDAPPAASGSFGKIADYKAMPDVLGVHLGSPPGQTFAALQREFPKPKAVYRMPASLGYLGRLAPDDSIPSIIGAYQQRPSEKVEVRLTLPPNPQMVYKVFREAGYDEPVNRGVLLAALRQKYGKETFALKDSGGNEVDEQAADDGEIKSLYWLFDEQGRRAPVPSSYEAVRKCLEPVAWPDGAAAVNDRTYDEVLKRNSPWCASAGVVLKVYIIHGDADFVTGTHTHMADTPLALRSLKATVGWWQASIQKKRQQEVEASKQKKPKL